LWAQGVTGKKAKSKQASHKLKQASHHLVIPEAEE